MEVFIFYDHLVKILAAHLLSTFNFTFKINQIFAE